MFHMKILEYWLSLRENILFNAELYKKLSPDIGQRIEKFSRLLDFRNQLDRTAHKVSKLEFIKKQ